MESKLLDINVNYGASTGAKMRMSFKQTAQI